MPSKLNIYENPFEKSLKQWEANENRLKKDAPLKTHKNLPQIVGITKDTARWLGLKSLAYLLLHDENRVFLRYFFKRPLYYGTHLIKSYLQKKSYHRDEDFFFYDIHSEKELAELFHKTPSLLVVGFSYCHKPFECPKGRFSDLCKYDPHHPVCGQCFIGKMVHHLPTDRVMPLFIPTIHYIGEKMFELTHKHKDKQILFLITACEMTLEMFGDWGQMIRAKGIGVRLDGRICNTMKAFTLSEKGIKPGLTTVTDPTQKRMISFIALLHGYNDTTYGKA